MPQREARLHRVHQDIRIPGGKDRLADPTYTAWTGTGDFRSSRGEETRKKLVIRRKENPNKGLTDAYRAQLAASPEAAPLPWRRFRLLYDWGGSCCCWALCAPAGRPTLTQGPAAPRPRLSREKQLACPWPSVPSTKKIRRNKREPF